MTKKLEMMKCAITNAIELEAEATRDTLRAYYRGKVMGVLEVAINGGLSGAEHEELYFHYKSEQERLL